MQRNKTQRRKPAAIPTPDVPGPFAGDTVAKATEDTLSALFAAETTATATITAIRGLRERMNPSGLRTFRIEAAPAPSRTTQKQRKVATAAQSLNGGPSSSSTE